MVVSSTYIVIVHITSSYQQNYNKLVKQGEHYENGFVRLSVIKSSSFHSYLHSLQAIKRLSCRLQDENTPKTLNIRIFSSKNEKIQQIPSKFPHSIGPPNKKCHYFISLMGGSSQISQAERVSKNMNCICFDS